MSGTKVLLTGGAGYVGSHVILAAVNAGAKVVVLDDLSTGRRASVPDFIPFVQGNAGDRELLEDTVRRHGIQAVMHFAGSIVAPESVRQPLPYYQNNVVNGLTLIDVCVRHGIDRFVFSSSAAVYGSPSESPISETAPTLPINPYGSTKLMTEWMLRDVAAASDLRYVALRYFNVAGADPMGRTGESTPLVTHLVKVACQVALGLLPDLPIYGDDYPTPDGTCVRDYVHPTDLADAHVDALKHLSTGGDSLVLNCGYGRGFSVKEVVDAFDAVLGRRAAGGLRGRADQGRHTTHQQSRRQPRAGGIYQR